jgi:hypothetical protein
MRHPVETDAYKDYSLLGRNAVYHGTYCLHLQDRILAYEDKRRHKYRKIK